jgi:ABC-type dipeptide/oligopeptide/nickel transport system ATPase subunit
LVALKNFPPWLKRKCLAVAQHTGTHAHILTHSYTHTHTHTHIPTTYIHACPSQLQRLAVARALCARPAPTVLVMDEALGSVPEQDEVS